MRKVLLAIACGAILAACSGDTGFGGGGGDDGGGSDPTGDGGGTVTGDGSGGTVVTSPEDDPIICVGNPDEQVVCGRQSEFWDCDSMPNGEVKCASQTQEVPTGDGTWDCHEDGGQIVCTTSEPNVEGGAGWTCVSDDVSTTCEKDMPAPPGGTGDYECSYSESEFTVTCVGDEPPEPPPTEPPTSPTGGGTYVCYEQPDTTEEQLPMPPEGYWAKLIGEKVLYNGIPALHVKLTYSKAFVDNTYGQWSIGYGGDPNAIGGHHSFGDLVESDKAEIFVPDSKGNLLFHITLDYISPSEDFPSGYGCLGVEGGEGFVNKGTAEDVIAAQSSLAVNFNGYGYVLTDDSPKTDLNYTPDPAYPKWIFEMWYETWIKWTAFGDVGPGKVYITGLHASPNKTGIKKFTVVPGECP